MTVLRRLEGITYWVLEDPDEIYDLVNANIRWEWVADLKGEGKDPRTDHGCKSCHGSSGHWKL